MTTSLHSVRFPGESAGYRGGQDIDDVETVRQVRLSELFDNGKDSLILYSFMFGPKMAQACTSCTSILDGLNGTAPHVVQRVNFAVVARSPIQRIRRFARDRAWRNLRLLSSSNHTLQCRLSRRDTGWGPDPRAQRVRAS